MIGWDEFVVALAVEVLRLPEEAFLVLREPAVDPRFAQFVREWDCLRAEVAGEVEVGGQLVALSADARRLLTAAGWLPPVPGPARDTNWWQEFPSVTDIACREVARGVVVALRDVQGLASPSRLVYLSWHFGGRRRLDLNLPGIPADQF